MGSFDLYSILITIITVLIVFTLEKNESKFIKKILKWVPAILFAYIIPAIISSLLELDLKDVIIHNWSKKIIIPIAIISIMASLSIKSLYIVGIKPLIHFLFGSFSIAVIPILMIFFMGNESFLNSLIIDQEFWKGIIPMVGSWIGGSTSMVVLKEYVSTPELLFLSILVLDNIIINFWTLFMFQFIKQSKKINRLLNLPETKEIVFTKNSDKISSFTTTISVILIVTFLSIVVNLSFISTIIILSFIGLFLGNSIKSWDHNLCLKIGTISIICVMAILGLKLDFNTFELPFEFIIFIIVWLLIQFVISIITAYFLKISIVWVPISNMANVGGISTAPAVTAAYKKELMPHAIVLAILSMVTGTFWGIFSVWIFNLLIL
ncbi:MAG: DUF819 family protein [Bacteroidota bacterium]